MTAADLPAPSLMNPAQLALTVVEMTAASVDRPAHPLQSNTRKTKFDMSKIIAVSSVSSLFEIILFSITLSLVLMTTPTFAANNAFGPNNPFYAPSPLPYQAPPFDKIKDSDYQPAIDAGMAQQRKEMQAIAENPAPPTFENTIVAMEKTGQLL